MEEDSNHKVIEVSNDIVSNVNSNPILNDTIVRVIDTKKKRNFGNFSNTYHFKLFDHNVPDGMKYKIWLQLTGQPRNYSVQEVQEDSDINVLNFQSNKISGTWAQDINLRTCYARGVPYTQLEFSDGSVCQLRRFKGRGLNVEYEILHIVKSPVATEQVIGTISMITQTGCYCGGVKEEALVSKIRLYSSASNFSYQLIPLFYTMAQAQQQIRLMIANGVCGLPAGILWLLTISKAINSGLLEVKILDAVVPLFMLLVRLIVYFVSY
ncbi:hypothetical protein MP228_001998 [Amoeboaphelidium protococcarum]|nr:hypothetical protein MP228_001998 [Amoeboaphelidium protococcarum]